MALQVLDDQQQQPANNKPAYKHFCKICKKGFGCGRALGGHMRAHGIGADDTMTDENDENEDLATDSVGDEPAGNKRMYALRTNPNRNKSSCRVCENCGLEFSSWKSFLEHGKCTSQGYLDNNIDPSPGSDDEEDGFGGWSKGKRSKRAAKFGSFSNCPLSEEEDLANCLVMLSSARVDQNPVETEESCSSASKEEEQPRKTGFFAPIVHDQINNKAKGVASKGLFECKACKKVFNSHQALGGHRASHKKVKGCYAAKNDSFEESTVANEEDAVTDNEFVIPTISSRYEYEANNHSNAKSKSKVHECSICHRIFSSGQALGGHKRCHWVTSTSSADHSYAAASSSSHQFRNQRETKFHERMPKYNKPEPPLALNIATSVDDIRGAKKDMDNLSGVEVDTKISLRTWIGLGNDENSNNIKQNPNDQDHQQQQQQNNNDNNMNDSKAQLNVKLSELSDLKDMKVGDDGSTPWLQVGIGSSTASNVVGKDSSS